MHKVVICGLDTSKLPKITAKECDELLLKVRNGDSDAKETLVMSNLRLVLSVVQRFSGKGNSDDLFQVGCVGLMKAVNNFNPAFNVKFSTYAVPMIIGEIRRYLKDSTSIKVSRNLRDVAYKALRAKELYEINNQRSPSMMEIAEEIDIPISEVACALDAVSEPRSLYESVYSDGDDSMMLMEQLSDNKSMDDVWSESIYLKDSIKKLPEKERQVLTLRYYVGKTQMEISEAIGISQAQVSRLEKNALNRLREMIS